MKTIECQNRINGKLIPWVIEIDDEGVLVASRPRGVPKIDQQKPKPTPPVPSKVLEGLKRPPRNGETARHTIAEFREFRGNFFDPEFACFFEGCAELRASFFSAVERARTEGGPCPPCVRGNLEQQFVTRAWEAFLKEQEKD